MLYLTYDRYCKYKDSKPIISTRILCHKINRYSHHEISYFAKVLAQDLHLPIYEGNKGKGYRRSNAKYVSLQIQILSN